MNGVSAGVQPWHPYRVDITAHVRPGVNRMELKVTNSLIRPSKLRKRGRELPQGHGSLAHSPKSPNT